MFEAQWVCFELFYRITCFRPQQCNILQQFKSKKIKKKFVKTCFDSSSVILSSDFTKYIVVFKEYNKMLIEQKNNTDRTIYVIARKVLN